MPISQVSLDPELVLDYLDVKVWRAYVDDDASQPETFYFTTNVNATDSGSLDAFDVRDIDVPSMTELKERRLHRYEAVGCEIGNVVANLVRSALVEAIDRGILPLNTN